MLTINHSDHDVRVLDVRRLDSRSYFFPGVPYQPASRLPAFLLSRVPGYHLRWLWYLSVAAVALQMFLCLFLVRSGFRSRLACAPAPAPATS